MFWTIGDLCRWSLEGLTIPSICLFTVRFILFVFYRKISDSYKKFYIEKVWTYLLPTNHWFVGDNGSHSEGLAIPSVYLFISFYLDLSLCKG